MGRDPLEGVRPSDSFGRSVPVISATPVMPGASAGSGKTRWIVLAMVSLVLIGAGAGFYMATVPAAPMVVPPTKKGPDTSVVRQLPRHTLPDDAPSASPTA